MKKKFLQATSALVIAGSLFTYSGSAVFAAKDDITGIALEQQMRSLINQGIMKGYAPGEYRPSEKITRGQFASLLSRALNLPAGTATFIDVPRHSVLADGISRAGSAGIVKGYRNGAFGMNDPITREQMAAMVDNALTYAKVPRKPLTLSFADSHQIDYSFRPSVERLVHDRIVSGFPDRLGRSYFKPKNEATRAEAAAFISGMLNVINEHKAQGSSSPAPIPPAQPAPQPAPPIVDTQHATIMGKSVISPQRMIAFVKKENPHAPDIEEIAHAFIEIGNKYGVRGDIAFCQSILETGWFRYDNGTAVTPDQHNYGGLGVTQKGIKGNIFPTVREGITAQIQHLYAYASTAPLPAGEKLVDQRFDILERYGKRGTAVTWQELSGRWAGDREYGKKILAIYQQLQNF